jgi:hypothetical protein
MSGGGALKIEIALNTLVFIKSFQHATCTVHCCSQSCDNSKTK